MARNLPLKAPLCDLPDVNVWLALLNSQHPHHAVAKAYWDSASGQSIAFCRITMLGLLRLSTNKTVMGGTPYTTLQAWELIIQQLGFGILATSVATPTMP